MAAALHGMQSDIDPAIVSSFDIGIANARGDVSLQIMLREAESALTIAHAHGQNRIAHYDANVAAAEHRRLALLTRLHNAVERKEFTLHFQPVVDLATREVVSHEALLRWRAADLGDVSPVEFIPLAESTDAIESITDWVLDNACAVLAASGRSTNQGYRMSVNISAPSLQRPGLARRVVMALDRHRLSPRDLCLELTERTQMDDPHGELSVLRSRGVALAIDDFGSGYSNLEMLALLPADTLKLDIQFVRAIEAQSTMRDLCQSLLAHVERHGTRVIAEGIETQAQHDLLCSMGCHYGQGWLYGRPSPQLDRRSSARIGLTRVQSA
jgi:EAL domain-containing protein (putative c-di-GMP-specific phosphodiesterase class I)